MPRFTQLFLPMRKKGGILVLFGVVCGLTLGAISVLDSIETHNRLNTNTMNSLKAELLDVVRNEEHGLSNLQSALGIQEKNGFLNGIKISIYELSDHQYVIIGKAGFLGVYRSNVDTYEKDLHTMWNVINTKNSHVYHTELTVQSYWDGYCRYYYFYVPDIADNYNWPQNPMNVVE